MTLFLINSYLKYPVAFSIVGTLLLSPLIYKFFRKRYPLPALLIAIAMLLLWSAPAEFLTARIAFGLHAMGLPEGREIVSTEYKWDSKQGGTVISVVYTDDPETVYNYHHEGVFSGIPEEDEGLKGRKFWKSPVVSSQP